MDRHGGDDLACRGDCLDGPVVHLIGGPYVTVGAQRREVPEGSKQLLALVALRRRPVARRWAAEILWPFAAEGRAAGNLRSALWRLRRAKIEVLAADKWSLALSKDVLVDLYLIEQQATRLIDGTALDDDLAIWSSWADALDFLPGWYDDWVVMERERIRQRSLHALEALSDRLVSIGRFADAVEAAMLAVSAEPLRESAQKTLMMAHIAEGNLVEAHRCFLSYRDLLRQELGVDPSAELLAALHEPAAAYGHKHGQAAEPPVASLR